MVENFVSDDTAEIGHEVSRKVVCIGEADLLSLTLLKYQCSPLGRHFPTKPR